MGQMQIHILSIEPVFWPKNETGPAGCCFPLKTSGQRPNSNDSRSGKIPTVEEILAMLRKGVYLGEAITSSSGYAVQEIRESSRWPVEPNTPASFHGKNAASSSNLIRETLRPPPPTLMLEIQPAAGPPSGNKLTQPKPTSGYMKPLRYGGKCLKAGPPVKQQFRGNRSELSQELPRLDE